MRELLILTHLKDGPNIVKLIEATLPTDIELFGEPPCFVNT
jgi:hypothetical protein